MIEMLHLIDDANVGGVTRGLAQMATCLGPRFRLRLQTVATVWRLAPRLPAGVVVVDFTLSWAKLLFLLTLRLRHRGPLVIVEHSYTEAFEQRCVSKRIRFRIMLRLCFRLADRVVAVSHGQAAWMARARLVHPSRLVCIPQAIEPALLLSVMPDTRRDGPLRLGAYGRFVPQKGFDILIEAMRHVPAALATLEIAGYGADAAALREAAANLPHVRITGPVDGPVGFLSRVQAVVIPSRWEAYGLVAQEARAAARPIIASDLDGLREQVDDECGLLVPAEQPVRLAEAIRELASRPLEPMAGAARASVRAAYERKGQLWSAMLFALPRLAVCGANTD